MDLLVLDTNFEAVSEIDEFESLIWADRYNQCGDFEIYTAGNVEFLSKLQPDYYIWNRNSRMTMIVEDIEIDSDIEDGNRLIFKGRSLESILDRRIIWKKTVLNGNFQDGIEKLLNENVISPDNASRKIENFIFEKSTDPRIAELTIEAQFTGDNLYDAIASICQLKEIGFRIELTNDNKFKFGLYVGEDRSYNQVENPYVIFSPSFDNIINSNYLESKKKFKTVTLVAGEETDTSRKTLEVAIDSGGGIGLTRRELYTDARDIASEVDGVTLSTAQYNEQLTQRGKTNLLENGIIHTFEGEVDTSMMFEYNIDFFIGDIVQNVNEYGIESRSRITEVVRSQTESGNEVIPTFTTIE